LRNTLLDKTPATEIVEFIHSNWKTWHSRVGDANTPTLVY